MSITLPTNVFASMASVVLMGCVAPVTNAQSTPQRPGAQEILSHFEAQDGISLRDLMLNPERFRRSTVDSVLDGLERLALTSKSDMVRRMAASNFALAGGASKPMHGMFGRIVALYERGDHRVRSAILDGMRYQGDRTPAIRFLERVAMQTSEAADFPDAPFRAVAALHVMGKDGQAALAVLAQRGLLRDPSARGLADWYQRKQ